jgi:hypothetical protein
MQIRNIVGGDTVRINGIVSFVNWLACVRRVRLPAERVQ